MGTGVGNTVKTAGLFAVMWAVTMALGALVAAGTGNSSLIWVFAGVGVVMTFVSEARSKIVATVARCASPSNVSRPNASDQSGPSRRPTSMTAAGVVPDTMAS